MKDRSSKGILRCAIYTRVSTDQGLEQNFNSLDAQREASEAYIKSQAHEGWRRRCQTNEGSSTCSATAISRAVVYAARARHSAKAAERLCL
jgi:DNA invertase Pin-like site-specific DNA recombinase